MESNKTYIILVILLIVDRLTKLFVNDTSKNFGVSFNVFSEIDNILLIFFSLIILFVISLILLIEDYNELTVGLIVVGAMSNILDRMFYGYVTDFIDYKFFIGNLADVYLTIAFILLFIEWILKENKVQKIRIVEVNT